MSTSIVVDRDKKWHFYSILMLFQALHSLRPWFLWWLPGTYATIAFFVISLFFLVTSHFWTTKDAKRICAAIIVILLFQYQVIGGSFSYHILKLLDSVAFIPIILLKPHYQRNLLDKFQKIMAFILMLSLIGWAGHLAGVDLPSQDVTYGTVDRGNGDEAQYYFSNHFLYLVNQKWQFKAGGLAPDFLRFCAVFLEPGYIAILMVFFLFINSFNFRDKKNIVFLLTIIASVSLAGYIMTAFAYLGYNLKNSKHGLAGLIFLFVLLWYGGSFFKSYDGGNNFINKGILERLEYDQSSDNIAGYNRTSEYFDTNFNLFIHSEKVLLGINRENYKQMFGDASNVGYKVYIMEYGLVGLLMFLFYLFLIAKIGDNYSSYILFLLYIIMFMRGHHTMWSMGFALVYICGIIDTLYIDRSGKK